MFKTNTKVFCKEATEKLTKDLTGGSNLMLRIKPIVPRGRLIIVIGYKYNVCKVLSFIVTDNTGITQAGLTYLSKYPDQFYNVSILPVVSTLVMYNLFLSVNEVGYHNKSRHYDLVLDKLWVTQFGWVRLCTTVDM